MRRYGGWCALVLALLVGCRSRTPVSVGAQAVRISTGAAVFTILSNGDVRASALEEARTDPNRSNDVLVANGKPISDFALDLARARVSALPAGWRIEISGSSRTQPIDKLLTIEISDRFPALLLSKVSYRNAGARDVTIESITFQRRRLNATLAHDGAAAPYDLWSFQGSSFEWGHDEVLRIPKSFAQDNQVGAQGPAGMGGGIPVVDFWTRSMGIAFGHFETAPQTIALPVSVDPAGRIEAAMRLDEPVRLKPGDTFATPRAFVAVHTGDYYDALRMWSAALREKGWNAAHPSPEAYSPSWCSYGYLYDFRPAQVLAAVPKLKEMGIRWVTVDYRWFEDYGVWKPRPDTFPGDAMRKLAASLHSEGMSAQLWWQPLTVEDGSGEHALGKPMVVSPLAKQHPDWLILARDGRRARLLSPVSTGAAMCPALSEVREYTRALVRRFIGEWGYDGHKLDGVYSVPPCYNPKHRHRDPNESVRAVADLYRMIYQTTRALKPGAVTQICSCGSVPNMAWLGWQDQPVTADPVGAAQVRRRIKMYKALLGPDTPVYGDHVELSSMRRVGPGEWMEDGRDFASTVALGGVPGTKFTWPSGPPSPLSRVELTPEKDALWKKWFTLYRKKMLSRGTFRNLYTLGYDDPEGYVIEKDGKTYYAFFRDEPGVWTGAIELRGLRPGRHRLLNYETGQDLGFVDGQHPRISAAFRQHLLIEAR